MKKLFTTLYCCLFLFLTNHAQQQVWSYKDGYQIREIVTTNNSIFYKMLTSDADIIGITHSNQNGATLLTNFLETNHLTVFGNKVVFSGRVDEGFEIWITDGTITGTMQLTQFGYGEIYSVAAFNNKVYFTNGNQIWYTDGTVNGTKKLLEVPTTDIYYTSDIVCLTPLNNKLIYYYKGQLGVTDGISSSVNFLSDKNTTSLLTGAYPILQVLNDKLFFPCYTTDLGMELWSTDGTDTNTGLFMDMNPGTEDGFKTIDHSLAATFSASDGKMYYTASNNVWVTDGTPSGTSKLYIGSTGVSPYSLKSIDGNVYFSNNYSNGFFFSDGKNNTVQNIGATSNQTNVYSFIKYNDSIYFVAYDTDHGYELWKTTNKVESTTRVTDICPGSCLSFNSYTGLIVCDNTLFFSASNTDHDIYNNASYNWQLWKLKSASGSTNTTTAIKTSVPISSSYPNPCEDYITVELSEFPASIKLISASGIVHTTAWRYETNQAIVSTQDLLPGMYKLLIDGYEPVSVIKK